MVVVGSAIWILYGSISVGIDGVELAKYGIIWGGREFTGSLRGSSYVKWVGYYEFIFVEVGI